MTTEARVAQWALDRRATKAFDSSRRFTQAQLEAIATLLRYAPSSTNSQPWRFVLASTEEGCARIADAAAPPSAFAYNHAKLKDAALVVVMASRAQMDEVYLEKLLQADDAAGRFATPEARATQQATRTFFVNSHRFEKRDLQHWADKQVFLALGSLLLAAEAMGVQACPIEGFDNRALDEELDLPAQGFVSTVLVALGYRSEKDFNANLPKSRLPEQEVITWL